MLTLRELLEQALQLPDKVLNAPANIQLVIVDENGNQVQYITRISQLYVLREDNYIGPSGIFPKPELEQMLFEDSLSGGPGEETMKDYDLYIRKDEAIVLAEPFYYRRPEKQTELMGYSHAFKASAEEPAYPAIPHMRIERE